VFVPMEGIRPVVVVLFGEKLKVAKPVPLVNAELFVKVALGAKAEALPMTLVALRLVIAARLAGVLGWEVGWRLVLRCGELNVVALVMPLLVEVLLSW